MPAPRISFGEWMLTPTQDGQLHEDEVRIVYLEIEKVLQNFSSQINRHELFITIARCIYEQSG
jgi:hypothetical protein